MPYKRPYKSRVKPYIVFVQNWEESERGWGSRPDGFTIHSSLEEHKKYVEKYYAKYNAEAVAPDCYTRTSGPPIPVTITYQLFAVIKKKGTVHGIANYFDPKSKLVTNDISHKTK